MSGSRSLLFATSHIADAAAWEQRYARWLRHHRAIDFGEAVVCLIDDGSPWLPLQHLDCRDSEDLPTSADRPFLLRFGERLGRPGAAHYPGWWRSFLYSVVVAQRLGCKRILHVESDTYVLTQRMARFMRTRETGWTAFWCPRWNFPETCVQVICADQFARMHSLWNQGWLRLSGQLAERVLPFTEVVREPHGNRYGESRSRIPGYADFAAQVRPDQAVWFR